MKTITTVFLTLLVSLQMMAGKAQLKIHVSGIPKELKSVLHDATARVQNQITRQEENSVVNDGFFLTAFCGNGIIHSFESVVMVKVFKKH